MLEHIDDVLHVCPLPPTHIQTQSNLQYNKHILETLFYLTTPLEHIDFHTIGYWTLSILTLSL